MIEFLDLPDGTAIRVERGQSVFALLLQYPKARTSAMTCHCVADRRIAERLKKLLGEGDVPVRYQKLSFETWRALPGADRAGKEDMLRYAEAFSRIDNATGKEKCGLVLSGMPGIGKTGLASCVLLDRARRGTGVLWIDFSDLLEKVKATYSANTTISKDEIIGGAVRAQFLLIDDLGDMQRRNEVTDHTREVLYSILSQRYNHMRETLITTNLDKAGFEDQFGVRIASRVKQMCYWVDATGVDLREAHL